MKRFYTSPITNYHDYSKYINLNIDLLKKNLILGGKKTKLNNVILKIFNAIFLQTKKKMPLKIFNKALSNLYFPIKNSIFFYKKRKYITSDFITPVLALKQCFFWLMKSAYHQSQKKLTYINKLVLSIIETASGTGYAIKLKEQALNLVSSNLYASDEENDESDSTDIDVWMESEYALNE